MSFAEKFAGAVTRFAAAKTSPALPSKRPAAQSIPEKNYRRGQRRMRQPLMVDT
jgi:hypothetical protein